MVIGNLQSQVSLFNYFAQEIFFQEPAWIRDFLLDCCLFEWLSPALCDAVTSCKNSARVLSELAKRNAFVFRIPEYGYRFHNLFRDFLYSKLTDRKRKRSILLKAGDYSRRVRKYDEALKFYAQANAYNKMAMIVVKIGSEFIGQGRSAMLCAYIEQIPAINRNKNALLLISYAQALIQIGRLDEAKRSGLRAYAQLKKHEKMKRRCADVLYALGGIGLNQGKYQTAERYYTRALKICPRGSNLTRASILNSLGSLNTARGGRHLRRAVVLFAEALRIAQKGKYKEIEASILNNWAMSEQKMGNLHEAYDKIEKMVPILEKHFSPGCGAGFFNAARLSVLLGYEKQAKSVLDLGLRICSPYNDMWSLASLWNGYALLYQETGDIVKAGQYADKALKFFEKLGIERLIIITMNEIAKMSITNRDYIAAEKLISTIWIRKKSRDDTEAIPILLTEANLKMVQGDVLQAEETLCKALALAEQLGEILQCFLIHIALSRIYYAKSSQLECGNALREAIRLSQDKGYEHLLLKELQRETWMLQLIREQNIEMDYIMGIIKKSKLDIHWIEGFLFGVPKVLVDDHVIADDAWRTIKAKKLFFYLLLNKHKGVNSDTLIETLWPGVPYKKGGDSLRKAVQHIRGIRRARFVREGELVYAVKGLCQVSPNVSIRLDTDEFDSLYKQVKESQDKDAKQQLLHRTVDLFKGGFAIGWYDSWVEDRRLYYRRAYEECLSELAGMYYDEAMYIETASMCEKLLSVDFLEERHHHLYMSVLAKLGRYYELEEDYKKLKKTLKKELNTEPQAATSELYSSLIGSHSGSNP
jgi:DNA-binding SARP family transcriptional activator/Flp pilus assembly protein TadD